jgi:hypothetical protein
MIPARRIAGAGHLFVWLLAGLALPAPAGELPPLSRSVMGGDTEYVIQRGDSLTAIGARFGVAATLLAQQNAIPYEAIIHPGQRLYIHNPTSCLRRSTTAFSSISRSACCSTSARTSCAWPIRSVWASPAGPRRKANSGLFRG